MRRAIKIVLGILGGIVLLLLLAFGLMQTGFGKSWILAEVEAQLADPPAHLEAQALEGFVPFDMTLVGAKLSDAQGVWLEADRLALDWSPMALFGKTFRIDTVAADRIAVLRSPIVPPSPPSTEPASLEIPRLPVEIDLRHLAVDRLELGPKFLGEPAVFAIRAAARLGDPAQGLQVSLGLDRIDRDLDRASLTLDYRPEADTLAVDARAEEPTGGLVTKLLGLAGAPDFELTLAGSGPLTDWQAKGQATLDEKPLLDLSATSKGPAQDRAIAFDAKLSSVPMLPENLTPLIADGIAASGQVHIGNLDQPIGIEALSVKTRAATLAAKGTIDPAKSVDLAVDLNLPDSTVFATLLPPELAWNGVTAQLRLAGAIAQPKVSLDAHVADLAFQDKTIGDTAVNLAATVDTEKLRADAVTAALDLKSISLSDPQVQPLLTDGVTLDFAGALDGTGAITADRLDLHGAGVALSASGRAESWGETAKLEGTLDAGDLAPLLALGGLQGKGAAHVDLSAERGADGLQAALDATTSDLSLGIADVDRLAGPAPKLNLALRRNADGMLTIEHATLDAAAANATASGTMSADRVLELKAEARLKDIGTVIPQAKGGLTVTASVTGSADDPEAKVQIGSERLVLAPLTVQRLQVAVDAAKLVSAPEAKVQVKADLNALPASLDTRVAVDPQTSRVSAHDLIARLGSTSLQGKLDMADGLITSDLALASPSLGELDDLAGTPLEGAVKGTIALRPVDGKQSATLDIAADSVAASGVRIAHADLKASADDALGGDPALDASIDAEGIDAGGPQIERFEATAKGQLADLALTATATGANVSLATAANLRQSKTETRLALAKLDLAYNKVKASLLHPAEIALGDGGTTVSGLAIGAEGGTVTLDAVLSPERNQVDLGLKQIPIALARAVTPDLELAGTIDGTLRLEGPKSAPSATLSLSGKGLGVAGAAAPPSDLTLDGTWQGGQVQAKGNLALAKSGGLDFSASLPMAADPVSGFPVFDDHAALTAAAKGEIDLELANAFIPGGADHVAGRATVDLSAGGAVGNPVLAGSVALDDGSYENQRYGTRLQKITVRLEGSGSKLTLASLSAQTPGGGTISGSGDVDFADGMPVTIAVKMDQARLINAALGTAVTDGALQVEGALSSHIALTGKVKIVKAEIRIPDTLPADVEQIPVKEINLPPDRQAEADAADAPPPQSMKVALDLAVDAPEQVFVRGRGLDAELGGALKIKGTADQPIVTGALKLRRGDFNLLSRRLEFNKGIVTFSGGQKIDPELDFAATTKLPTVDVTLTVTGNATKPEIALSSSPELPQDEILAQLLYGKASGALSPFEAVQLAQATATLAGVGSGPGVLDKVRQALGLDRLDVEAGEGTSAAPSLSAGRYVSRGVFVGAKQGATVGSSAATVEIELTPNVKVETDVGADSSGKAGINLEWNY